MTMFPALIPSSRTYTPGVYPHTPFTGLTGVQGRVRHSNVMLASQLRLGFIGLTEGEMLSILAHYQEQFGAFSSFSLPSELWSGVGNADDYQLASYGWRYAESPVVDDLPCGGHNVEIVLETVPPEGVTSAGLARTVLLSIAGGLACSANGLRVTIPALISAGVAGPPGLNEVVSTSFDAGVATCDVAVNGLSQSVITSIAGGSGCAASGADLTVSATIAGGTAVVILPDPYFSSVSLLLHMDGADGSTSFADSSSNNFTVTRSGNAQIDTAQSKFGGASGYFDGTGDYLTTPSNSAFSFGTGDYTMECWFRVPTGSGGSYYIMGTTSHYITVFPASASTDIRYYTGSTLSCTATVAYDTWYHLAVTRSGTTARVFLDGTKIGETTSSTNFTHTSLEIGRASVNAFVGWIDEVRITKGVARYTSNFTPPAEAFPNS